MSGTNDPNDNGGINTSNINRGLQDLTGAFGTLGVAVLSNSSNLSDYGKALEQASNGLGNLGRSVPGIGNALGALGSITGKLGAGLLSATEITAKNFQSLARSGFLLEGGMSGAALSAVEAGMALDKFGKFVEENNKFIRAFGGLGGDALETFTDFSRSFRTETTQYAAGLRRLGYDTEEINETLVRFASINRQAYLESSSSAAARNKAAYRFAVEMDRMSQLTGENRKELMKKMEADRREGRVQAYLRTLNADQQKAFLEGQQAAAAAGPLAKKAFEDMAMQGSLTGESANAAAIYGTEFINSLQTQAQMIRNINVGDDLSAIRTEMATSQGIAIDALNEARNTNVATLRASGGYVKDLQDAYAGQTDILMQTEALIAESGGALTAVEARIELLRRANERISRDLGAGDPEAGVDPGPATDALTNAYSSLTTAIDNVNTAINTQLIGALQSRGVQTGLNNLSNSITEATPGVVTSINNLGSEITAAVSSMLTEGLDTNQAPLTRDETAGQANRLADDQQLTETGEVTGTPSSRRFFGGMLQRGIPTLVGEGQGGQVLPTSEVVTPNMNSLVVTMKQMATKARETLGPQMQQMADQMRPQMEQMASQFEPQLQAMASQMQRNAPEMQQQMEVMMGQLNGKFDQLLDAYRDNTREIRRSGGNVYRT